MAEKTPEQRAKNAAQAKAWRLSHPEEARAGVQKAWAKNRDRYLAQKRESLRNRSAEISVQRKAYREAHREKIAAQKAASRLRNLDATKARDRKYYTKNKDRLIEQVKEWTAANPIRVKANKMNSLARKRGMPGEDMTARQWEDILAFYGHACAQCQTTTRPLGVDHYRPLTKGGIHHWANIWPVCQSCNSSKFNFVLPGAPPHAIAFLLEAS